MTDNTQRTQQVMELLYKINSLNQQLTSLLHMIYIHVITGIVSQDKADMLTTQGINEFITSVNAIMSQLIALELKYSINRPQSNNEQN